MGQCLSGCTSKAPDMSNMMGQKPGSGGIQMPQMPNLQQMNPMGQKPGGGGIQMPQMPQMPNLQQMNPMQNQGQQGGLSNMMGGLPGNVGNVFNSGKGQAQGGFSNMLGGMQNQGQNAQGGLQNMLGGVQNQGQSAQGGLQNMFSSGANQFQNNANQNPIVAQQQKAQGMFTEKVQGGQHWIGQQIVERTAGSGATQGMFGQVAVDAAGQRATSTMANQVFGEGHVPSQLQQAMAPPPPKNAQGFMSNMVGQFAGGNQGGAQSPNFGNFSQMGQSFMGQATNYPNQHNVARI